MANPFYNTYMQNNMPQYQQQPQLPQQSQASIQQATQQFAHMNPVQRMQLMLQAMQNPAAFVNRMIPDIPKNISNDPNQILQYLQRTRGVTDSQIQQLANQVPMR